MNYKTFHFSYVDATSTGFLEFHPTFNMSEEDIIKKTNHVTIGGELSTYRIAGNSFRYTLPFTHVTSSVASELTDQWLNQKEMYLTFNMSEHNISGLNVVISNLANPFAVKSTAEWTKFSGFLRLNSTDGGDKLDGGPFILDDAVWGKLGQNYNRLT